MVDYEVFVELEDGAFDFLDIVSNHINGQPPKKGDRLLYVHPHRSTLLAAYEVVDVVQIHKRFFHTTKTTRQEAALSQERTATVGYDFPVVLVRKNPDTIRMQRFLASYVSAHRSGEDPSK